MPWWLRDDVQDVRSINELAIYMHAYMAVWARVLVALSGVRLVLVM